MTDPLRLRPLAAIDPDVSNAILRERTRQNEGLELIASENFASAAVMAVTGSILTNKYAEGYPGRRYYGGCEFYDEIESLAIARARALFGAEHANVQPHSGAQANMAAYFALLQPGDTVLGMNLSHGGHLTHGHPLNFSGKLYTIVPYGVRSDDERLDYDAMARLADEHRPKMIIAGASAYPRVIEFARIAEIAKAVDARVVVDMAHIAGLVAAGVHPTPVPHADVVTTTTHKTLRGPRGGLVLCRESLAKEIDRAVFPGVQGGPLMHAIAGKAVCLREAAEPSFTAYQRQIVVNARRLADALVQQTLGHVPAGVAEGAGYDCQIGMGQGQRLLANSASSHRPQVQDSLARSGPRARPPRFQSRSSAQALGREYLSEHRRNLRRVAGAPRLGAGTLIANVPVAGLLCRPYRQCSAAGIPSLLHTVTAPVSGPAKARS